MQLPSLVALGATTVLLAAPAHAQSALLANYEFANSSLADSAGHAGVVASDMSATQTVMFWSNARYTTLCLMKEWNAGGYLEFNVGPTGPSDMLDLALLEIHDADSGSNPVDRLEVYADEDPGPGGDNFRTLIFATNNIIPSGGVTSVDLSGVPFLQGVPAGTRIRLHYVNGSGNAPASGNYEIEAIKLFGSPVCIGAVDAEAELYGAGVPGCDGVPTINVTPRPKLGVNLSLDIGQNLTTATTGCMVWSASRAQIPLPMLGGDILVGIPPIAEVLLVIPPGGVSLPFRVQRNCGLEGHNCYLQAFFVDRCSPTGMTSTQGLSLLFGSR